jgi:hypothetical protein
MRDAATSEEAVSRVLAARTVASHALGTRDRDELLSMLGLPAGPPDDPGPAAAEDESFAVAGALTSYVRSVAGFVGVPPEGTSCELTDTATAYLALPQHAPGHPDHDLMLVWDERDGWAVSLETDPNGPAVLVGRLGGDLVPSPEVVAHFVADVMAGRPPAPSDEVQRAPVGRRALAERMNRHLHR